MQVLALRVEEAAVMLARTAVTATGRFMVAVAGRGSREWNASH
jgi:hypothetical protein